MATEDESWREQFSNNNEGAGREGLRTPGNNTGRTPRPRIARPAYSASASGEQRFFRPRVNREEGAQGTGYRPNYQQRGEGTGYRPNYQQRGEGTGYRPNYQLRGEGTGYRPNYQQRGEGTGYRPNYQQRGEGTGYRPNYQQRGEGTGYRPNYQQRGEGEFVPSYQQRNHGFGNPQRGNYGGPQRGVYGQQRGKNGGAQQRQRTGGYNPNAKYSMKKRIEYSEAHIDPNQPLRLNKFLANAGVCSRREADDFIQAGVVSVNGNVVTELGTKVMRSDTVMFHDQLVTIEKKVYVLLNKPKDYVTTSDDPQNRKTVMDLVQDACRERIYPVGRLDRNTTGVLLLTNDGDLASKLTHPQYLKKKIYHVYLDKNVTAADMHQIAEGITLDDGEIRADAIDYASETDKKQVGIEIHSGRNRIVRRIFEHFGYRVLKLDRVFFAGLTKKNLRRGDWRYLTEKEVNMLRMGAFE